MERKYFSLGSGEQNLLGEITGDNIYDYGEYEVDLNNKNESHAAIVRQVSEKSTVLDIGCASGIIGKALKKHKKCVVDGIDYDKEALKVANEKGVYRNLYAFSITEENSKAYQDFFQQKNKYDYIIFADVLEHLVDPWNAIKNATKLLKKNGSILISLPNIANLDIIRGLINNEFNYQRHGILDSTHIRFFTEKSFKDMVDTLSVRTGVYYNIELCERTTFTTDYINDIQMTDLFNLEKRNLNDFLVLQNIFKLTVTDTKKNKYRGFKSDIDYFSIIDKQYSDMKEENKALKEQLDAVTKENNENKSKLNSIVNSKRWQMINKVLRLLGK